MSQALRIATDDYKLQYWHTTYPTIFMRQKNEGPCRPEVVQLINCIKGYSDLKSIQCDEAYTALKVCILAKNTVTESKT